MQRRGSEWSSIYLLVVVAIAAVLLVTFVKPLFKQAQQTSDENTDAASNVAKSAIFGLTVASFAGIKKFRVKEARGQSQRKGFLKAS